jgi:hypothetical protein
MSIFNTPNYHLFFYNFSLLFSPPTNEKFTFFYQQSNKSHKKVFQFQQHSKRHTLVKNKKSLKRITPSIIIHTKPTNHESKREKGLMKNNENMKKRLKKKKAFC